MLIAARNAMMVKSLTARDYVQDGLVAMWDGIENAGWGVHDANATEWKDLSVNGYNLVYGGASAAKIWEEDCFKFVASIGSSSSSPHFLSSSKSILSGLSSVTFSICLDISMSTGFGVPAGFRRDRSNNRLQWYRQNDGRLDPVVSTVASGTKHLASTAPYTKNTTKAETIVVGSNGNIVFYINGAQYATNSISDFATITSMGASLGVNIESDNAYAAVLGTWTMKNMRLYNRALTADEIAANYAVDKARFNLP